MNNGYSWPDAKYYDKYSYEDSYSEYTRRLLGDATGEMGPFYSVTYSSLLGRKISSWYTGNADFVNYARPWFMRGFAYNNVFETSVFAFGNAHGSVYGSVGFRIVLVPVIELN